MSRPFHFQQFSMYHHRATMKIGTDAVLLSVWVDLEGVDRVLDVGTGSGVIALLLASRKRMVVDAVEPDERSATEAGENFAQNSRLGTFAVYPQNFQTFADEPHQPYDLIISNPPFFMNDLPPSNNARRSARHTGSLSYEDMIVNARKLLLPDGKLSVVLPYYESKTFLNLAFRNGFSLKRQLIIFPKPCKEPNRINLELVVTPRISVITEKFIIRNEEGDYTSQYKNLLSKYYTAIR